MREFLINTLKELFAVPTPSGDERLLKPWLNQQFPNGHYDEADNFIWQRGEAPFVLLCAHLDTAQTPDDCLKIQQDPSRIKFDGQTFTGDAVQLGADDKCGLAIITALAHKTELPFRLLFTVREETGCKGVDDVELEVYNDVNFSISLDRRGNRDLIYKIYGKRLCSDRHINFILNIAKECGWPLFKEKGRLCDAYSIANHVPCINMSAGYYDPHKNNDRCVVDDMLNIAEITKQVIQKRDGLQLMEGAE